MARSDDADKDHADALAELERLRKQIGVAFEKDRERRAAPFDGLLGEPQPEWPEAESERWLEARQSMLDRYGEQVVRAWIEGKSGAGIPPQPSEDERFSERLSILRAAFYALAKGRQHATGFSKSFSLQPALNKLQAEETADKIRTRALDLLAKRGGKKRGIVKVLEVEGHSRPTINKALSSLPAWKKKR